MAQAAAEEDVDDVPRLGLEVRPGDASGASGGRRLQVPAAQQQVGRRDRGQAEAASRRKSRRVDWTGVWISRFMAGSVGVTAGQSMKRNSFALNSTRQRSVEPLPRDERPGEPRLAIVRRPANASRQARSTCASHVVARVAADARGEPRGALLHERVVRHGERLDRRDRPRPPRRHHRRVGAIERFEHGVAPRPRPEAVDRAAIDRVGELARRVGELVVGVGPLPVELDVLEARPADLSVRAPRRPTRRGVADGLPLQPPPVGPPEQAILRVEALGAVVANRDS